MEPLVIIGGAVAVVLTSAGLWLAARKLQLFPGDHSVQSTDEDADAFGTEVKVVTRIGDHEEGRIHFQGTSWPARCVKGAIEVGETARIVDRDNLVWIVERALTPKQNP